MSEIKPVWYWHKVENEDECDLYAAEAINGDCPHCIPLYTQEVVDHLTKQRDKLLEALKLCAVLVRGGNTQGDRAIETAKSIIAEVEGEK